MNIWDVKAFSKDLSEFIKLIEDYAVPVEVAQLRKLEGQLRGASSLKIDIDDIVININKKISGTKPPGVTKIAIYFSHKLTCDPTKDCSKNDPVTSNYYFFFQINGYGIREQEYTNCWRLDQDIVSATSKYTHPYYHFQAGGDELQYLETGDLLLLSAPRLPHPPMDLFLGMHFLLSNYLSTKDYPSVKTLFESYEYQQIIVRAQQRMWESYFNCFHSSNSHLDFTFEKVFPLFIR
jgi:hypothetical protein